MGLYGEVDAIRLDNLRLNQLSALKKLSLSAQASISTSVVRLLRELIAAEAPLEHFNFATDALDVGVAAAISEMKSLKALCLISYEDIATSNMSTIEWVDRLARGIRC